MWQTLYLMQQAPDTSGTVPFSIGLVIICLILTRVAIRRGVVPINADKPHLWKPDIALSVDFYNNWFMQFAPLTYRDTRIPTTQQVESASSETANLTNITSALL
jgi:hypothetical protein